jgi:pimeloyl-[acyl-carrier protein] methyl ester esterase
MRLAAEQTGSGPDLVLLHGWGMNRAVWGPLQEGLSQHLRITALELPGHGDSPFEEGGATTASALLDQWVEAALASAPPTATWLGWSLGAQLVLRAAVRAPQRVKGIIGIAATPRFVKGAAWPHALDEPILTQFSQQLVRNHQQTLERFLALQLQGESQSRLLLRHLREQILSRPEAHPRALAAGLTLLRNNDLRSEYAAFHGPALWLLGGRDTLTPAAVAESLRELNPAVSVRVIPGAGHVPFLSRPATVLRILNAFFEHCHA